jgi:hypothetical protein
MAKTINKGPVTTNETSLVTSAVGFDFDADFRVKSNTPGEAKLVNTTTPIDRPEFMRFAYSEIKDIYNNTDIDDSVKAISHKGVQILVQLTDVWSLTDDTDASYRVDLPVSAHLVIKVPACEYISSADVLSLANRMNGGLYDSQTMDSSRLQSLLRGALVPSGL